MVFGKLKFLICITTFFVGEFAVGQNFDVVIKNRDDSVEGERIEERSIPYSKISAPFQEEGDVLFFDGQQNNGAGAWRAHPISGLNFVSGWNVERNNPKVYGGGYYENDKGEKVAAVSGDYLIITKPGSIRFDGNNDVFFAQGDWIIFNGETWDRISNNGTVARVFKRKGHVLAGKDQGQDVYDYTWEQVVTKPFEINKNVEGNKSSIFDLSNVESPANISNIENGKILTWDKTKNKWVLSDESSSLDLPATGQDIVDGEIVNADINNDAGIEQSKIDGLTADLAQKLDSSGGNLFGHLETSGSLIFVGGANQDAAEIGGVSVEELENEIARLTGLMGSYQNSLGTGDSTKYLNKNFNFVSLNTDHIVEKLDANGDVVGEKFLTDERVFGSVLTGLPNNPINQVTDTNGNTTSYTGKGINRGESILNAISRVQVEINNYNNGVTMSQAGGAQVITDHGGANFSIGHLAVDSDGTDHDLSTDSDYDAGFLKFNGSAWNTYPISGGLSYKGNHDATTTEYPDDAASGDYYIISNSGDATEGIINGVTYRNTDWLVCINPGDPSPADEKWLKINNVGNVVGFEGASDSTPREGAIVPQVGDYKWKHLKTEEVEVQDPNNLDDPNATIIVNKISDSKLEHLTNVFIDPTSPYNSPGGDTLKYLIKYIDDDPTGDVEFEGWVLGIDKSGGSGTSATGTDMYGENDIGSDINKDDIADNADIKQSKISGLVTDLGDLLNLTGGELAANLDLNNKAISIIKTTTTATNNLDSTKVINFNATVSAIDNLINGYTDANNVEIPGKLALLSENTNEAKKFYDESKNLISFNTDNFPEVAAGATNLYFTDARVFEAKLFGSALPTVDQLNQPNADRSLLEPIASGDSIYTAIQKLDLQIATGTIPSDVFDGANIKDKSLTNSHLAETANPLDPHPDSTLSTNSKSPQEGDIFTVVARADGKKYLDWTSVKGIRFKDNWDVLADASYPNGAITNKGDISDPDPSSFPSTAGLVDGDYYKVKVAVSHDGIDYGVGDLAVYQSGVFKNANTKNGDYYILTSTGSFDGISWVAGDWAIYDDTDQEFKRIPSPSSFQSFMGRQGIIEPTAGDFTFPQIDTTAPNSLTLFNDVDLTGDYAPTATGQVLKWTRIDTDGDGDVDSDDGFKWVAGADLVGLTGTVTSANVVNGSITSEIFNNTVEADPNLADTLHFYLYDFQAAVRTKVNSFYNKSSSLLSSHLNLNTNIIDNCHTILPKGSTNQINVFELNAACLAAQGTSGNYLLSSDLTDPVLDQDDPDDTNDKYFLNERGSFVKINISDLAGGTTNSTYDEATIRGLPLGVDFPAAVPADEPAIVEGDTLLVALSKIWNRANASFSLTPEGVEERSNTIDIIAGDNKKTLLVSTGSTINLPSLDDSTINNGFMVTIKSTTGNPVTIKSAGSSEAIDRFGEQIQLKEKFASVRLIKGTSKWHIIHRFRSVE